MDSLLLFKSAKTLEIPGISVTGIPPLRDLTSINLLNHPSSRRRCSQNLAMIRRNAAFDPLRMKAAFIRLPAAAGRGRGRGRGHGRYCSCDGFNFELKGGCNIFIHILAAEDFHLVVATKGAVVKIGGDGVVKVKTSVLDVEVTKKIDKVESSGLVEVAKKKTCVVDVEATKKLDKVESTGCGVDEEAKKKKTAKVETGWASLFSCLAAVLRLWALCAEFILLVTRG